MKPATMRKQRGLVLVGASALVAVSISVVYPQSTNPKCGGVELFGICDPYVPGVLIKVQGDHRPILVIAVLAGGPADKAGLCPGDQIVGVNGLDLTQSTAERLFQELVAKSPSSLVLKVWRGEKELQFRMRRIRESTVARMSRQAGFGWISFRRGCP